MNYANEAVFNEICANLHIFQEVKCELWMKSGSKWLFYFVDTSDGAWISLYYFINQTTQSRTCSGNKVFHNPGCEGFLNKPSGYSQEGTAYYQQHYVSNNSLTCRRLNQEVSEHITCRVWTNRHLSGETSRQPAGRQTGCFPSVVREKTWVPTPLSWPDPDETMVVSPLRSSLDQLQLSASRFCCLSSLYWTSKASPLLAVFMFLGLFLRTLKMLRCYSRVLQEGFELLA